MYKFTNSIALEKKSEPRRKQLRTDALWAEYYGQGRNSTAPVFTARAVAPGPSTLSFTWAPLINVYTQSTEMPAGYLDVEYVKRISAQALDGREWTCCNLENKVTNWQSLVVDVPIHVSEVLEMFGGELEARFVQLMARRDIAKGRY